MLEDQQDSKVSLVAGGQLGSGIDADYSNSPSQVRRREKLSAKSEINPKGRQVRLNGYMLLQDGANATNDVLS